MAHRPGDDEVLALLRQTKGARMRVAFLDDSEQANPPRAGLGHLLAIAAVIFPQERLTPFATDLVGIAASWASRQAKKSSGTRTRAPS